MSDGWHNDGCGDIQGRLIDLADGIWDTIEEKIDDLQGLKDEITSLIYELNKKLMKREEEDEKNKNSF